MYTYCLFCETIKAQYIVHMVSDLTGCHSLSPKQVQHTWKKGGGTQDIIRDLLPGYVFLYAEEPLSIPSLRGVPGIIRSLSDRTGNYELQGADEAFALMLLEKNGIIGKTKVYEKGQMIRICDGVFAGISARILKVERRLSRMKIQIPFAHQLVNTWVEYEIVEPEKG